MLDSVILHPSPSHPSPTPPPPQTEESKDVIHFQYTDWPDFGVPETADLFLTFLQEVRESGALGSDVGPCIVHCR